MFHAESLILTLIIFAGVLVLGVIIYIPVIIDTIKINMLMREYNRVQKERKERTEIDGDIQDGSISNNTQVHGESSSTFKFKPKTHTFTHYALQNMTNGLEANDGSESF